MGEMTLEQMELELQGLFGERFFQFAFYVDNRQQNNIGKYWLKVETDLGDNNYRAWQVRDAISLRDAWNQIIPKIKESLLS